MQLKKMICKKPYLYMVLSMVAGFIVLTVTGLGAKLLDKIPGLSKYNV